MKCKFLVTEKLFLILGTDGNGCFSILLPLSCQLSSHNSMFFLTDFPHLHIRHYQSQPQREASPTFAFSLVDNWPVPQEGPRMDKILHNQIPGSTYWCSTPGYQKTPTKSTQSKQNLRPHSISQPQKGYHPFMLFCHHSHSGTITTCCPFGSRALRGVVYVLPCSRDPHTSCG